jgi:hypothetical protein
MLQTLKKSLVTDPKEQCLLLQIATYILMILLGNKDPQSKNRYLQLKQEEPVNGRDYSLRNKIYLNLDVITKMTY